MGTMDQIIIDDIKRIVQSDNVFVDEPMCNHTTFRIGGNADVYVRVINDHEVADLIKYLKEKKKRLGYVEIVDMFIKELVLQLYVQHVTILRVILRSRRQISDENE